MFPGSSYSFQPDRCFGSAIEAFEFIAERYVLRPPIDIWLQGDSGVVAAHKAPRYIFRGENGEHETTLAGVQRPDAYTVKKDGRRLSYSEIQTVRTITDALIRRLFEPDYLLDPDGAIGLVQHYGLPTSMIDFTRRLETAFTFACSGNSPRGRIAVLSVNQFVRGGRGMCGLTDMAAHKWAERAQRQHAFGLRMFNRVDDLKSDRVREQLSLTWYEFPISDAERIELKSEYARLTNFRNDPSAGFLRFHITEFVEANWRLAPLVVDWLLERIPCAPRCYMVKGFDGDETIVLHRWADTLNDFDEDKEREYSRRYWSSACGDRSWDRMNDFAWPDIGGIVADPRTYHSGV